MKKRCSHFCESGDDEEKRVSFVAFALGLSTRNIVLAVGAIKEVD